MTVYFTGAPCFPDMIKGKFVADFRKFPANFRKFKNLMIKFCVNQRLIRVNLPEKKLNTVNPLNYK